MTMHCHHCKQELPLGQAELTYREIQNLPMTDGWDVIKWQCVKGAAVYYEVNDWTQKVDRTLTYEENIELMSKEGYEYKYDPRR